MAITPLEMGEEYSFKWDPIGSPYSIKAGYEILRGDFSFSPPWDVWKQVLKLEALPKIKNFIWALGKGKIPTTNNLKKKGIQGASSFPLCNVAKESIHRLFFACSFAQNCQKFLTSPLIMEIEANFSILDSIDLWKKKYPYAKKKKSLVKIIWDTLPYAFLWNIWLMRNKVIFHDQKPCVRKMQSNTWSLTVETILAKKNIYFNVNDMQVEERQIFICVLDHLPRYQRPSAR